MEFDNVRDKKCIEFDDVGIEICLIAAVAGK